MFSLQTHLTLISTDNITQDLIGASTALLPLFMLVSMAVIHAC